jgi:hypothetical protein
MNHPEGKRIAQLIARAWTKSDFDKVDREQLAKLPDKDLAAWQSEHSENSPQFLLAQYEWSRRLGAAQIKATRWAAWFGIAAAIVGAILGSILTLLIQESLK